jgi:hypothetical protein
MEHIYEVVDSSDDERYYALGIFLAEQDAMSVLDGETPPSNDDDPEAVTVEVRRRTVGFHPHEHTVIASRTWVRNYEDDKPDWSAKPIKLSGPNTELRNAPGTEK